MMDGFAKINEIMTLQKNVKPGYYLKAFGIFKFTSKCFLSV